MGRKKELQEGVLGPDQTYQADLEPVTAHVVAQYHNQNEGSSFYVHGGGRAPKSGYAVGGFKGMREKKTKSPVMQPEEYQKHRDAVRKRVKEPNVLAGTWVEKGRTVMDASERVPDEHTARNLQIARKQRAVYNLATGEDEDLR